MSFKNFAEVLIALKDYEKKGIIDSRLVTKDGKVSIKAPTGQAEIVNADGGYTVSGEVISPILHSISQNAVLWNKATKFYSSGDNVNTAFLPFVNETARTDSALQLKSYWPSEGGSKTEAKFSYGLATCKLNKIYSLISVTDELWEDSSILQRSIEEFVTSERNGSLFWQIERAMLIGDGTTMYGIMGPDTNGTIEVAVPDPVVESTILNYVKALAPASQKNSEWYMSKENYNDILDINWTNEYAVSFDNGYTYLMGMKVNVMEQMDECYDLMLGDVSQYAVALKAGPLVE